MNITEILLGLNTETVDARINSSIGSQCGNGNAELLETQIQDLIKVIEPEEYTTT